MCMFPLISAVHIEPFPQRYWYKCDGSYGTLWCQLNIVLESFCGKARNRTSQKTFQGAARDPKHRRRGVSWRGMIFPSTVWALCRWTCSGTPHQAPHSSPASHLDSSLTAIQGLYCCFTLEHFIWTFYRPTNKRSQPALLPPLWCSRTH